MKRVYVNEEWCLGCRLCEYWCVFSASGEKHFPFAFEGGLSRDEYGAISIDKTKCVGCHTCIAMCPYGCIISGGDDKPIKKCQLCAGKDYTPQCVAHCPANAIVFEEEA